MQTNIKNMLKYTQKYATQTAVKTEKLCGELNSCENPTAYILVRSLGWRRPVTGRWHFKGKVTGR